MEAITNVLIIVAGLLVRLAIPIIVTAALIFLLKKLDARWQDEAQIAAPVANIQKPECWKIKGCSPEQIKNCIAASSPLPC